jgi:hypothetical protein
MNDPCTFTQSFSIVITDLKLVAKEFDVPEKNLRVTLAPSDVASGTISVQIRNTSQDAGRGLAKRIVDDLFDELLLEFAHHITEGVAPKPGRPSIVDASGHETLLIDVEDVISLGSTADHAAYMPNDVQVSTVTDRVRFRLFSPQLATSAQLYSAKRMFSIGMQSEDEVVRFQILYSAVALAALFKCHSGKQENVDMLLQQAAPGLVSAPTGRNGKMETVYTKIRNDFVHAEERAVDPSGPMQEIHQRLREFQRDVAAVLKML